MKKLKIISEKGQSSERGEEAQPQPFLVRDTISSFPACYGVKRFKFS